MRFRLRTLMILLAVMPPLLWLGWGKYQAWKAEQDRRLALMKQKIAVAPMRPNPPALPPSKNSGVVVGDKPSWEYRLVSGQQVIFKSSQFGLSKLEHDGGWGWAEGRLGNQRVTVSEHAVWQNDVPPVFVFLPKSSWETVEVTLDGKDFSVAVDDKPYME